MSARKRLEAFARALGAAGAVLLSVWASAASAASSGSSNTAETPTVPAGTTFVPSVGAYVAWTDNVHLAPPGEERSGVFEDVEPGFSFTHGSSLEQVELSYTLHAMFFGGGQHDFLHSANLFSITRIVPEWFELDLSGIREQGLADPALAADLTYLFPTANLANYTTGIAKPTLRHTFRSFQAEASYSRGISDYGQAAGGSSYRSNIQGADATVSSIDKNARLTWNGTYQRSEVDYESPYTLRYLYENAGGELGLLTIPTLRILGRGGKESDPGTTGLFAGGLASTYWSAGLDRSSGPNDDLRILVGHRYFGRTYEGSWREQLRLLNLQVTYTEQPNTQEGINAGQLQTAPPLVTIPGTYPFTRLGPGTFLDKSLNGAATLTGRVTEIGVSLYSDQRQYYAIATPGIIIAPRFHELVAVARPTIVTTDTRYEDRFQTATLYLKRRLGPLTDVDVSASYGTTEESGFSNGGYKTQRYSAMFTRRLGRWSSLYLRADHVRQYGELAAYTMNVASIGVTASFGNPRGSTNGLGTGLASPFGQTYGQ